MQAAGPDFLTDILGTSTRSLQLSRHGNFHALMATGDSLTDVQWLGSAGLWL